VYRYGVPPRPDHRPDDRGPTLLAQALMNALRDLKIVRDLVGGRVLYKRNSKGEHVVAVIFPPQPP
jgi:hypothetical protein